MIERLRKLLSPSEGAARCGMDTLQVAAAALMVEVAVMDGQVADSERDRILELVEHQFGLSPDEARELFRFAEVSGRGSSDLWAFTSLIKTHFSQEERVRLVEMLWHVAYADGVLHDYEAHLLRRIAGLIYVSDHERGAARQRVLSALGLANLAADGQ